MVKKGKRHKKVAVKTSHKLPFEQCETNKIAITSIIDSINILAHCSHVSLVPYSLSHVTGLIFGDNKSNKSNKTKYKQKLLTCKETNSSQRTTAVRKKDSKIKDRVISHGNS